MPLLLSPLPILVPVHVPTVPAVAISRKSTSASVARDPLRVIVRCVPTLLEVTCSLRIAVFAAPIVSTLETVWLSPNTTILTPVALLLVCVRLLNVLAPLIVVVPLAALLNVTL
jgi:hypothetical protein